VLPTLIGKLIDGVETEVLAGVDEDEARTSRRSKRAPP
jgi:hypothetical protein